jgi:hypothetical protein
MKKIVRSTVFAFSFCIGIVAFGCTDLSGIVLQEERDFQGFTGISLAVPANVSLTQGNEYFVKIEADKVLLEKIETKVVGNTLKIYTNGERFFSTRGGKIAIHITMPKVEELNIAGSGDINAISPITTDELTINIAGSGDVRIDNLTVDVVNAKVAGSGDIAISGEGKANSANIKIAGSGDVVFKNIEFTNGDVNIAGSGDTYLSVSENLKVNIVGSGDLIYSGNPQVEAKVLGSGSIKNK